MNIGEAIRARRLELNMTQEKLAEAMGYKSKTTINKIEMGINDIPLSKVKEFSNALHTSVSYLMGWTDDPNPYTEEDIKNYDPLDSENYKTLFSGFSYALKGDDSVSRLIDASLELNAEQMQQLIKYAEFLNQEK